MTSWQEMPLLTHEASKRLLRHFDAAAVPDTCKHAPSTRHFLFPAYTPQLFVCQQTPHSVSEHWNQ